MYGEARGALDGSRTWYGSPPVVGRGFPEHVRIFYCRATSRKIVIVVPHFERIFLRKMCKIVRGSSRRPPAAPGHGALLAPSAGGGCPRACEIVCYKFFCNCTIEDYLYFFTLDTLSRPQWETAVRGWGLAWLWYDETMLVLCPNPSVTAAAQKLVEHL